MRAKLGLVTMTIGLATSLTFSVMASAAPTDSTTTSTAPAPTSAPEPTTTPAPTTTIPPLVAAPTTVAQDPTFPVPVDEPFDEPAENGGLNNTRRSGNVFQTEPPPPPTTTTTTTLPPPPPVDPLALPANSGDGRRAVYSKSAQRLWAVDSNGVVIKTHRVSGKLKWCDPRPGTYSVWSRSRYTSAIQNPTIKWGYMVRFTKGCNGGNIGFHEIPSQYGSPVQSISQLGQPLSGGCVRQAVSDAVWMWEWAYIGTKVVVLP